MTCEHDELEKRHYDDPDDIYYCCACGHSFKCVER